MTEQTEQTLPPPEQTGKPGNIRTLTHVLYALYAVHWLTGGLTALIALIIDYVKRDDAAGTEYEAHFTWQIRTFWISLVAYAIGIGLAIIGVGLVILAVTWVWTLYRIVKGWLYLHDGKTLDARAWF